MSLETLKRAAADLDEASRRELFSYLVSLREQQWAARACAVADRLDDQSPERWLTLEAFREKLEKIPAPEA